MCIEYTHDILLSNSLAMDVRYFVVYVPKIFHVYVQYTPWETDNESNKREKKKWNLGKHENESDGVKIMNSMKCKLSTDFAKATGIFAQFVHLLVIFS